MRGFLAAALLGLLASPTKADIVDSGSLQIGGQGVIGGTFTVQGNALGVAGAVSASSASLSASGAGVYSLTTSSGIHILSGVLEWPDGSKSTTASSGLGSAANTIPWITSTTFSAVTCFTLSGLSSPGAFSLVYHSTASSSSGADVQPELYSQVNGDTANKSTWTFLSYNPSNGFGTQAGTNVDRQAITGYDCGATGGWISGQATITTGSGVTAIVGTFSCKQYGGTYAALGTVSSGYTGEMTSLKICRKTGTFSGWAKISKVQD